MDSWGAAPSYALECDECKGRLYDRPHSPESRATARRYVSPAMSGDRGPWLSGVGIDRRLAVPNACRTENPGMSRWFEQEKTSLHVECPPLCARVRHIPPYQYSSNSRRVEALTATKYLARAQVARPCCVQSVSADGLLSNVLKSQINTGYMKSRLFLPFIGVSTSSPLYDVNIIDRCRRI